MLAGYPVDMQRWVPTTYPVKGEEYDSSKICDPGS